MNTHQHSHRHTHHTRVIGFDAFLFSCFRLDHHRPVQWLEMCSFTSPTHSARRAHSHSPVESGCKVSGSWFLKLGLSADFPSRYFTFDFFSLFPSSTPQSSPDKISFLSYLVQSMSLFRQTTLWCLRCRLFYCLQFFIHTSTDSGMIFRCFRHLKKRRREEKKLLHILARLLDFFFSPPFSTATLSNLHQRALVHAHTHTLIYSKSL